MLVAHTSAGSHSSTASSNMWALLVWRAEVVLASTVQRQLALTGVVLVVVAEVEAGQLAGASSA